MADDTFPTLGERVPPGGTRDADEILDRFLGWVADIGFELYPAQEEALLELMAGRHVILDTPTGSGKSLVALGLHFKGLCEGRTSFYTSPIKALASEKFFALCDELGAAEVGMLTGDASINPVGRVVCCTAEVLANMALRRGEALDAPYVVMDEFHYYDDRDRGVAWQVPLIALPETRFLLMSATLGDTSRIVRHIEDRTGVEVAVVSSGERPVPLEFSYRETPIHETVLDLLTEAKAPVYIVNFTQRECSELAQKLTSLPVTDKEEKAALKEAVAGSRFDTPYGKEFRRFLSFGIGVHHAGLLPKYRRTVEQLAQRGLLKVVSGTDTLGVGVNIPLRTVLFTGLAKYDGRKVTQLKIREFKQIAGRAGRRGFDDRGWVVAQAPEHVIERRQLEQKDTAKKKKKLARTQPKAGTVNWSEDTFQRLVEQPPETLASKFRITAGMLVDLLHRDAEIDDPVRRNFHSIRELIALSHEDEGSKARHLTRAAQLVRSLRRAGVVTMVPDVTTGYRWVIVDDELQIDFSLFHNLSLFLVEAVGVLDPESPDYPFDLLSVVEAVLEDPHLILRRQVDRLKTELLAQLKADDVPYQERMARLDEVTHPQPGAEAIQAAFELFRQAHPWVGPEMVRPKGVAREMLAEYLGFTEMVRRYGLQRSEGVLLRYISQVYKTLDQNVPDAAKTDAVHDTIGFFRAMIERVDTSLIEEWESLLHPELLLQGEQDAAQLHRELLLEELLGDERALAARVRAEMHALVKALARRDWEEAADSVRQVEDDPVCHWPPERFEEATAPFFERFGELVFDHRARLAEQTQLTPEGDRRWKVVQVLLDHEEENLWHVEGFVELTGPEALDGPLVTVRHVGT